MNVENFIKCLKVDFFTGVPDSQLKALCNYLIDQYGISKKHIIAANEGNSTALAAGYHLATGKIPMIYLQNSGIGNIINPVVSLLNKKVYGIPCIFVVGWRGEPEVHDEPQHIFQGEITLQLLENIGIHCYVMSRDTTEEMLCQQMAQFNNYLENGESVAFVVKKGALNYSGQSNYKNNYLMNREEIIKRIIGTAKDDLFVSTTGKTSRELFEVRENNSQGHDHDFLTVGSMGHSSSIALGIALQRPEKRVWCIDGDGAVLMHMGAMAVIGSQKPKNMIHVVVNNEAHESVGGLPTAAEAIKLPQIAEGCGYSYSISVENMEQLDRALLEIKKKEGPIFIEVKCAIGARENLGRPTSSPYENKKSFMKKMSEVYTIGFSISGGF